MVKTGMNRIVYSVAGIAIPLKWVLGAVIAFCVGVVAVAIAFALGMHFPWLLAYVAATAAVVQGTVVGLLLLVALGLAYAGIRQAVSNSRAQRWAAVVVIALVLWMVILYNYDALAYRQASPQVQAGRYLIACNFYNNESILKAFFQELVRFIAYVGKERVFVSIFENGSKDNTPAMLQEFAATLSGLGIAASVRSVHLQRPNPIVMQGYRETIYPDDSEHDRIEYLAKVRNAALQPLFTERAPAGNFTQVLFFNDVIFHAEEAVTLLESSMQSDVACAVDLDGPGLYDRWVVRDQAGRVLSMYYPYFVSPDDRTLVARGTVVPVYSCWNGIAFMNARPFVDHSIRFRRNHPSECYGSECFFVCHDFRALGFQRMHMHAGVTVAYEWHVWYVHRLLLSQWWLRTFIRLVYDYGDDPLVQKKPMYLAYDNGVDCVVFG